MPRFKTRQYLPEYNGMKNVIKITDTNGALSFSTKGWRFFDEASSKGACKLNFVDNDFGFFLHLFDSNNETVGVYKMHSGLRGFTAEQLVEQKNRLYFCKVLNLAKDFWETCVYGNLVKVTTYKEGCGLATILKDEKWSVIDRSNNYVVPPGKYDYIDGFDKCGLARVKKNGIVNFVDPSKSTKDRWGIIDTKGEEILPLEYSEIWAFYNKNRRTTTVWKGDMVIELEDGEYCDYYEERVYKYDFNLITHELILKEDWSEGNYNCLDPDCNWSPSDDCNIWDALETPEAAGNIDYGW